MLQRKAMDQLMSWKNAKHYPLIVDGARQVGKTFIVREFGRAHYAAYFELNFLENPNLRQIFSGTLHSDQILMLIRTYYPTIEYVEDHTLIFLDEVQECPEAITALKFLASDKRFDVIASGSALGMAYKQATSFPVGYVEYLDMYALDFEEFLWAKGIKPDIIASIEAHFEARTKVHPALHSHFMKLLTEYIVVGGMPEVVQVFIDTADYIEAHNTQKRLHRDYLTDIARFSEPDVKIKAEACYTSIPKQLFKENHKFQYGVVESKGTARKFESSIDWLESAHFVVSVTNVSALEFPLQHFSKDNNFRLYPTDIGMLLAMYDEQVKTALLTQGHDNKEFEHLMLKTAKGGIYEGLAADFLYKKGHENLYFYRNDNATVEIEFLLQTTDGIVPIEIKSGKAKSASLDKVLQNDSIPYGYKFSAQNVGVTGKRITLPLYMMMFLPTS